MSCLLRTVGQSPCWPTGAEGALVFGAAMMLVIAVPLRVSDTSSGSAAQPNPSASAYSVTPQPRA
jgi:hypothetical protein